MQTAWSQLSADFPAHGGAYLFLPDGRREAGETPLECASREPGEEAGVTAQLAPARLPRDHAGLGRGCTSWRPAIQHSARRNSPRRTRISR
ncbi:NUDIX domain-containing protein [Streptomyces sp. NPDC052012]|uniref:NUDIX domain-containing protein n=1 Tax=Streptomyces sp. NPDC052012 TaxID=3155051 RepID=UPI00344D39A0